MEVNQLTLLTPSSSSSLLQLQMRINNNNTMTTTVDDSIGNNAEKSQPLSRVESKGERERFVTHVDLSESAVVRKTD
jgi:hypothetical protein